VADNGRRKPSESETLSLAAMDRDKEITEDPNPKLQPSGLGTQLAKNSAKQLGGAFRRYRNQPQGMVCELTWSAKRRWFRRSVWLALVRATVLTVRVRSPLAPLNQGGTRTWSKPPCGGGCQGERDSATSERYIGFQAIVVTNSPGLFPMPNALRIGPIPNIFAPSGKRSLPTVLYCICVFLITLEDSYR
jgi:hypothetical protein